MTPKSDPCLQRTALFAGSFDPFTIGHLRLAGRALRIADRLVIGVGINIKKLDLLPDDAARREAVTQKLETIRRAVRSLNIPQGRVEVRSYSCLTADFARECGADFLIRGVRGVTDFEYERNLADINLKLLGIDTVLLVAEPEMAHISSSTVRELLAYGHDVSDLLPRE